MVRAAPAEYPGVCDALAFDRELQLRAGQELRVSLTVLVADGALDRDKGSGQ